MSLPLLFGPIGQWDGMLTQEVYRGCAVPTSKTILCLANSKKKSGRCVAGREVKTGGAGGWVRPVSSRPMEEVSETERQYEDGTDPKVLDVIEIPLIKHKPHACQTENWLLDDALYWKRDRQVGWKELQGYAENPKTLWVNGQSTRHGQNDEIARAVADTLPNSLCLIHVPKIELHVLVDCNN